MAIVVNLNEKGFDYLNALTDVAELIRKEREKGTSVHDILDILKQLGDAAERRFNEMLEDLHKQYNSPSRE